MKSIFTRISEAEVCGRGAAVCIITETHGSTPAKAGSKMIVYEDGTSEGTIGGGNLERRVVENALSSIESGVTESFVHNLTRDHNMCCGGTVSVYVEPVRKPKRLYLFGAGHIGTQLSRIAVSLGFEIFLIDERADIFKDTYSQQIKNVSLNHRDAVKQLTFDENTYIFICTHLHEYDRDILAHCINLPHKYIGMIGSRRKVEITRKLFLENSIATQAQLEVVDMPAGIDIGAETPAEIAVSILARIIERGGSKTTKRINGKSTMKLS